MRPNNRDFERAAVLAKTSTFDGNQIKSAAQACLFMREIAYIQYVSSYSGNEKQLG